jgi:hypothetical protein
MLVRLLLVLLSLASGLFALDRVTLDDGSSVTGQVLDQNAEIIQFFDGKKTTNTIYKADIKNIALSVSEDKFYATAIEETNFEQQLFYLKKSIQRFPEERYHYAYLARLYLHVQDLTNANAILTNRALSNTSFFPIQVLHTLKSQSGKASEAQIQKLQITIKSNSQVAQLGLLDVFSQVDLGKYYEASARLLRYEKQYTNRFIDSYQYFMAEGTYSNFRTNLLQLQALGRKYGFDSDSQASNISELQKKLISVYRPLKPKEFDVVLETGDTLSAKQRHQKNASDGLIILGVSSASLGVLSFMASFAQGSQSDLIFYDYKFASASSYASNYASYQNAQIYANIARFSGIGLFAVGSAFFVAGLATQPKLDLKNAPPAILPIGLTTLSLGALGYIQSLLFEIQADVVYRDYLIATNSASVVSNYADYEKLATASKITRWSALGVSSVGLGLTAAGLITGSKKSDKKAWLPLGLTSLALGASGFTTSLVLETRSEVRYREYLAATNFVDTTFRVYNESVMVMNVVRYSSYGVLGLSTGLLVAALLDQPKAGRLSLTPWFGPESSGLLVSLQF